ncbi:hypothetical protein C8R45DRAFT_946459 [Mycena sanguinolenta]|nr:hypothetical protein C8R45DRAFT_946459 [Mycena sanguinolenta]
MSPTHPSEKQASDLSPRDEEAANQLPPNQKMTAKMCIHVPAPRSSRHSSSVQNHSHAQKENPDQKRHPKIRQPCRKVKGHNGWARNCEVPAAGQNDEPSRFPIKLTSFLILKRSNEVTKVGTTLTAYMQFNISSKESGPQAQQLFIILIKQMNTSSPTDKHDAAIPPTIVGATEMLLKKQAKAKNLGSFAVKQKVAPVEADHEHSSKRPRIEPLTEHLSDEDLDGVGNCDGPSRNKSDSDNEVDNVLIDFEGEGDIPHSRNAADLQSWLQLIQFIPAEEIIIPPKLGKNYQPDDNRS